MSISKKAVKEREKCTCKNSCLYYGSYYCDPVRGWCRKDLDKKWWKRLKDSEEYVDMEESS